jgi:hypothetical protein
MRGDTVSNQDRPCSDRRPATMTHPGYRMDDPRSMDERVSGRLNPNRPTRNQWPTEFSYPHDGIVAAEVPRAAAPLPAGSYRATGFQAQYRVLLNHAEDTKSTRTDDLQVFGMEISPARGIRRHRGDAGTPASDSLDSEGHRVQAHARSQSTHTGDSPRPHHGYRVEAEITDHGGGITNNFAMPTPARV